LATPSALVWRYDGIGGSRNEKEIKTTTMEDGELSTPSNEGTKQHQQHHQTPFHHQHSSRKQQQQQQQQHDDYIVEEGINSSSSRDI
jgi:hypothetical protein